LSRDIIFLRESNWNDSERGVDYTFCNGWCGSIHSLGCCYSPTSR